MNIKYLVTTSCPSEFLPTHREDHRLSRFALAKLSGCESLEIYNHHHLVEKPSTTVSLSHTKNLAVAAINDSPKARSIGIDIEWCDRECKPGIEKFFLREQDDKSLKLMELWGVKEAAYKAFYPLYEGNKTLVLKDFTIIGTKIYFNGLSIGNYEIKHESIEAKAYTLCLAQMN